MEILQIAGDLLKAQGMPQGQQVIAKVRLALITGGRGFLRGAGASTLFTVSDEWGTVCTIGLDPSRARGLYSAGAQLTDEEIRAGLDQLRVADEDVAALELAGTVDAMHSGILYAREQFEINLSTGDERALHRAWEMARKVNGLRKRVEALSEAQAGRST